MPSLSTKLWQRTDIAVLAACLLLGGLLLALPLSWKRTLGRTAVATVFAPLEKPWIQLRSLAASRRENSQLRERLAEMELKQAALRRAEEENFQLREMLGLAARWSYKLQAAEVSARQPGVFVADLTIDRGREDGLAAGMVVFSTQGLVGRLEQVDEGSALVRTIFHPAFRASALDQRSRVLGILRTEPEGGPFLDRVPLHADIQPGDTLITSGYGGVLPYGLRLGVVKKVVPNPLRLRMEVAVESCLNIDHISQVFVITGGSPPPPPLSTAAQDTAAAKPKRTGPPVFRPSLMIRPAQPPDEIGGGDR